MYVFLYGTLSRRSIDFPACIDTVIPPMHHAWYLIDTLQCLHYELGAGPTKPLNPPILSFLSLSVSSQYFELNALFF